MMLVLILRVLGWFGLAVSGFSGALKLFASDETALRYTGPGRDLDINILMIAICLIFLALAAILAELRDLNSRS